MTITIEKNIPMPSAAIGKTIYPWKTMEVGDSFAFPTTQKNPSSPINQANRLYAPKKFAGRTVDGIHRCWRIA